MSQRKLLLCSPYPVMFRAVVDVGFGESCSFSVELDFNGLR